MNQRISASESNDIITERLSGSLSTLKRPKKSRSATCYSFGDTIIFGKHKGHRIRKIFDHDPSYLSYGYLHWESFDLSDHVLEGLIDLGLL